MEAEIVNEAGEEKGAARGGWMRYRSAPYAWERWLLWLLILVCTGADVGGSLVAFAGG